LNGDRAIAGFEQCRCGRGLPLLKRVVGRRLDMLETPDGRRIPGEFFPHLIKDFASIRRFQVIQDESDRIQVCLVVNGDWRHDTLQLLERQIRAVVGDVVHLEIGVVENIPLTPAGKLRVVIRNFSSDGLDLLAPLGRSR
jgi:phenylacetate-CoA ligase